MRRKNWKNPGRVYVDSQVFEENIQVYASFEVFLEILEGLSISLSSYQITVITVMYFFLSIHAGISTRMFVFTI